MVHGFVAPQETDAAASKEMKMPSNGEEEISCPQNSPSKMLHLTQISAKRTWASSPSMNNTPEAFLKVQKSVFGCDVPTMHKNSFLNESASFEGGQGVKFHNPGHFTLTQRSVLFQE